MNFFKKLLKKIYNKVYNKINKIFGVKSKYQRYYLIENWYETPIGLKEFISVRYSYLVDKLFKYVPERFIEPYLSHIPVLSALAKTVEVKKVLELGCGYYSTMTFLDLDFFRHLQRLDSIENYDEWADKIVEKSNGDERLIMHKIKGNVTNYIEKMDLESYDLIFVDNDLTREERAKTIEFLAKQKLIHPIVVIHDYDMSAYQIAAKPFISKYRYTALYPNTGVVFNKKINKSKLIEVDNRVKKLRDKRQINTSVKGFIEEMKKIHE